MSSVVHALGSRSAGRCTKAHRHPFQQHNYRNLCTYDLEQTGLAQRPQGPQKFKRYAAKVVCRASAPESQEQNSPAPETDEIVFYEGSGSNAELLISLLLGTTLVYLPLTLASLGRRLWINYKFTNKRVIVVTNSPVLKREVQVEYSQIREIRSVPRAFGLWGDAVIFLKDGSRLELIGLENFAEIRNHIERYIT